MAQYTGERAMGSNNGPDVDDEEDDGPFDPRSHYRNLDEAYRLQIARDEVEWEMSNRQRTGDAEVVLNLSCGVQGTPHVMLTQVALFKALGVDFVATAGTQFCCGRPFGVSGDPELGDRVCEHSVKRLATWNSKINVQLCGSCLIQFQYNVAQIREKTGAAPFEVVHGTEFILNRLKEMGDTIPWANPNPTRTRRVLLHAEGAEVHQTKLEARNCVIETIGMIPGYEYAGLVEAPSVGSPCGSAPRPELNDGHGHTLLDDISTEKYREVQAELLAQARAVGAEAILTHHHKCHREWSKFSSPELPIIHYHDLLLEALGVKIPDRFRHLWQLGEEEILEETRPMWESWNIEEAEARRLVTKYFVPEYASQVQHCPCDSAGSTCFAASLERSAGVERACQRLSV